MTWLDACRAEVDRLGLDPELLEVLRAFGGDDAPGEVALDAPLPRDALPRRIEAALAEEVDPAQAALFARRFRSVTALLDRMAEPEARLLRVALFRRGAQILDAPAPHALRIRALVDFIWSQAAVVQHRTPGAPTLEERTAALDLREVAPGVRHGTLEGPTAQGPVHINVLRARSPRLRTLDARGRGTLVELCGQHGAIAGVSGGFFLYSEPDIAPPSQRTDPVGWLVTDGELVSPPVFRRSALVQDLDGALRIASRDLDGVALSIGAVRMRVGQDATLVHRAHADRSPSPSGRAVAVVRHHVVAVRTGPLPVPLAGFVLLLPPGPPIEVGDRVTYDLPPVREAMAGGPLLVGDGPLDLVREDFAGTAPPITFSKDETFDRNLLPRLAAGLTADGELVFAGVDGRNADRAPGLTLRSTAALMRALGCVRAMNLDGGSSKRMVVDGRVVDLPSTEVGSGVDTARVRPVHTAILVLSPR
jgi:hypothetical protein